MVLVKFDSNFKLVVTNLEIHDHNTRLKYNNHVVQTNLTENSLTQG